MRDPAVLICMVAHIPPDGVAAFQEYEAAVLPLLDDHNGRLIHRYQNADGVMEVHIVQFSTPADFAAFRASDIRQKFAPLLERSGAKISVQDVTDIA